MSLGRHGINASGIEPALQIGNFAKLNSSSPTLMVVDQDGGVATFAADVLANDRGNLGNRCGVDMEAASTTAALDKGKNRIFVR
jgi:hypothetical protein